MGFTKEKPGYWNGENSGRTGDSKKDTPIVQITPLTVFKIFVLHINRTCM